MAGMNVTFRDIGYGELESTVNECLKDVFKDCRDLDKVAEKVTRTSKFA